MTTVTALLTNKAYGYPTQGARRRRGPTILASLHQTANATATAISCPAPKISLRLSHGLGEDLVG